MPRYRQAERETALAGTRHDLLQAAVVEIAARGYAEANVDRISTSAGFAKGTIYNYFPGKQSLMLALLGETAEAHVAFMAEEVRRETDPVLRLRRFFEAGFAFVERHAAEAKVLIATLYGSEPGFKEQLGRLYQPLSRLVAEEILAPGIEQGVFRAVDPARTAWLLMTVYLGTSSQVDESGRPYMDPAQVADFAVQGLVRAYDP